MFKLLAVAVTLFIATNIDDVLVLIAFFTDLKFRASEVVVGQYLGIAVLVGISIVAALLSFSIPHPYIGLLGIVVIALAWKKMIKLFTEPVPDDPRQPETIGRHRHGRIATVALLTLANGGDNVVVYTPAFAMRSRGELTVIAIVFAIMTAIWCLCAHSAVNYSRFRIPIRRYGRIASPIVFIAIGIMVMFQADTFGLLLRLAR
jgi:cadmium resistance protein CadD (predicted permease)